MSLSAADDAGLRALAQGAPGLGAPAVNLLAVCYGESGFKASAVNPSTGAVGLCQFDPTLHFGPGKTVPDQTPESFAALSAAEQVPYVLRWFSRAPPGALLSARDAYWYNGFPSTVVPGAPDATHATDNAGFAAANPLLSQGKPFITAGDFTDYLDRKTLEPRFAALADRLAVYTGGQKGALAPHVGQPAVAQAGAGGGAAIAALGLGFLVAWRAIR